MNVLAMTDLSERPVGDGAEAPTDVLEFEDVSKVFFRGKSRVHALDHVSTSVAEGELLAIVGPSGCGKSTLLNLSAGLMEPGTGRVRYRGQPLDGVNTRVSYITQKDNLLPWRTVEHNVRLPLELARHGSLSTQEKRNRVENYIGLVGLAGFEQHYPSELSGGMRKRVSLARALVCEPDVLLMDEPFGALDAQLKLVLQKQLLEAWETTKRTLIFVTHDLAEAIAIADRVIVMSARPGHISAVQAIDLPRPRDVFSVRFEPAFQEYFELLWQTLRSNLTQSGEQA